VTALQDCYLAFYLTELAGATFMIFTRTCDNTRKMALMLRNLGFDAIPIHGQMAQAKRIGALNKFKAGERSILVATGKGLLHPSSEGITAKRALHAEQCMCFMQKHVGFTVCGSCVLQP
jgi:superfamily II DNA/RNA helicase